MLSIRDARIQVKRSLSYKVPRACPWVSTRVLPFTAKDDNRPVLACVNFVAGEGKLKLVSADGFRLAVVTLDYDEGEGQALISREDLRGIANALRKAKRVRLGFEKSGDSLYHVTTAKSLEVSEEAFTPYGQVHQRYSVR